MAESKKELSTALSTSSPKRVCEDKGSSRDKAQASRHLLQLLKLTRSVVSRSELGRRRSQCPAAEIELSDQNRKRKQSADPRPIPLERDGWKTG